MSEPRTGYDNFRENFLHARSDLMDSVPIRKDGKMVWIDVGGGTARNLEFLPVRLFHLHSLSPDNQKPDVSSHRSCVLFHSRTLSPCISSWT